MKKGSNGKLDSHRAIKLSLMNSARLLLSFSYIHSHKVSSKIRPAFDRIRIAYFAVSSGGGDFYATNNWKTAKSWERKKVGRNNWWAF